MSDAQVHHEQIEQRLRAALRARVRTVDLDDLRPAAPPTGAIRTLSARRAVVVLFGLAAAVACVLLVLANRQPETPVRPANTPSVSPTPSPTTPHPDASPSPIGADLHAAPATGTNPPPGERTPGPR